MHKSITKLLRIEVRVLMKINDKESVRGKRHIETLAARKASGSWRNGVPVVPELCCTTNRSQTPGLTPGLIVRVCCSRVCGGCPAVS